MKSNRTKSILIAGAIFLRAFSLNLDAGETKPERTNIVLILADDLGYGDTGCYGATKIQTPAIDRLAAEGMRLTDAYAPGPVCCPTRYSLLSGIYPWRVHHRDDAGIWATHRSPSLFTLNYRIDRTLASHLKEAGYTTGAVGKWHVGPDEQRQGTGTNRSNPARSKPGSTGSSATPRTATSSTSRITTSPARAKTTRRSRGSTTRWKSPTRFGPSTIRRTPPC